MKGFTLLHLLIIIFIFLIAAGLLVLHFEQTEQQDKISEARANLKEIAGSIKQLRKDTGIGPAHLTREPCVQSPELFLDSCEAGLKCTDGKFSDWGGPYAQKLKDPWGNYYYFDADYVCKTDVKGCKGVPNNTTVRAILSSGPNGKFGYDTDNIVHILCK